MSRLGGLWSGQVIDTPLGSFPMMNMDMKPANGHVLFSRDDLDSQNSLRFDFSVETYQGVSTLVFRNGGLFSGLSRDSRTYLLDSNPADGTYHFCAESCDLGPGTCTLGSNGCSYVDAVFAFSDADDVVLNVHVKQAQHLIWSAHRQVDESPPDPFPVDEASQGDGTAEFPPLPQLTATVTWKTPLAAATNVWLILAANTCSVGGPCYVSRSFEAQAASGSMSVAMVLDQLLPGTYYGTAVVDVNGNFATTLGPTSGDQVSLPNQTVTINTGDTMDTAQFTIVYTLP